MTHYQLVMTIPMNVSSGLPTLVVVRSMSFTCVPSYCTMSWCNLPPHNLANNCSMMERPIRHRFKWERPTVKNSILILSNDTAEHNPCQFTFAHSSIIISNQEINNFTISKQFLFHENVQEWHINTRLYLAIVYRKNKQCRPIEEVNHLGIHQHGGVGGSNHRLQPNGPWLGEVGGEPLVDLCICPTGLGGCAQCVLIHLLR